MASTHPREQATAVIVTTPEELRELVRDAVREALSVSREHDREPGEWLDSDACAALLGVHARTVQNLVRREGLPHQRIGKLYRFRRSDVLAWLEQRSTGRRRT